MRRALVVSAVALALLPLEARAAWEGAICHSMEGACRVEQEVGEDVVAFDCSCSDGSEQVGELEADPRGLFYTCATSLSVCGDSAPDDFTAAIDPAGDAIEIEIADTHEPSAGCRVGVHGDAWLGLLLLPLAWRRRKAGHRPSSGRRNWAV